MWSNFFLSHGTVVQVLVYLQQVALMELCASSDTPRAHPMRVHDYIDLHMPFQEYLDPYWEPQVVVLV